VPCPGYLCLVIVIEPQTPKLTGLLIGPVTSQFSMVQPKQVAQLDCIFAVQQLLSLPVVVHTCSCAHVWVLVSAGIIDATPLHPHFTLTVVGTFLIWYYYVTKN
jgi:hypothetical protein